MSKHKVQLTFVEDAGEGAEARFDCTRCSKTWWVYSHDTTNMVRRELKRMLSEECSVSRVRMKLKALRKKADRGKT